MCVLNKVTKCRRHRQAPNFLFKMSVSRLQEYIHIRFSRFDFWHGLAVVHFISLHLNSSCYAPSDTLSTAVNQMLYSLIGCFWNKTANNLIFNDQVLCRIYKIAKVFDASCGACMCLKLVSICLFIVRISANAYHDITFRFIQYKLCVI